jgi:hypothetical protein
MRAGWEPQEVDGMCSQSQVEMVSTEREAEWEPEPLPLGEQLEYPPSLPRRDDAHDSDQSSRIIVIDLA